MIAKILKTFDSSPSGKLIPNNGLILNSTDLVHNPDAVKRRAADFFPISYFKD